MTRITVVPYDPLWPQGFAVAAREIQRAFGANLLEMHHIGSTSIPNMHAKPVIDMLGVVSDICAIEQRAAEMESLGYEVMGEFGISGRRYFRRNDSAGTRTHQLHAFQRGSPHVARHLAFRDFMRAHPALADEYAALKRRLAAAHPHDMNAYMDGKDGFIKEMEARALAWAATLTSRMDAAAVTQYITDTFAGLDVVSADGNTFIFYDPGKRIPPDRRMPFVTVVTNDLYDRASNLDRPGVFRLNIGVGKETYRALFPVETTHDFTALDRLMPHPVYAPQHWLCILSPTDATFRNTVQPLLKQAYDLAAGRHARRSGRE